MGSHSISGHFDSGFWVNIFGMAIKGARFLGQYFWHGHSWLTEGLRCDQKRSGGQASNHECYYDEPTLLDLIQGEYHSVNECQ